MKKCFFFSLVCVCVALCAAAGVKPIDRKAPHRLSIDDVTGCRIGIMEAYNFLDDGGLDSVACHLGWQMDLSQWTLEDGSVVDNVYSLTCNQNDYVMPVEIDLENRRAYLYSYEVDHSVVSKQDGRFMFDTITTVYVFPESFLYQEPQQDSLVVVNGTIGEDGSIAFEEGIVFLTEVVTGKRFYDKDVFLSSDTVFSTSNVYCGLTLLKPNGEQTFWRGNFVTYYISSDNASSINRVIQANRLEAYTNPANSYFPNGIGGAVGTPIDPRPIKPGIVWKENLLSKEGSAARLNSDVQSNKETVPVFMYQLDDSTLMVYNLFGESETLNKISLQADGTMIMPGQQIGYKTAWNAAVYNCSKDVASGEIELGNQGTVTPDSIRWGQTLPYTEEVGMLGYTFNDNSLRFTQGGQFVLPEPVVPEWTLGDVDRDDHVTLLDVIAILDHLLSGGFDEADPYNIAAADVNQDGEVNVQDVSVLIDMLLMNN